MNAAATTATDIAMRLRWGGANAQRREAGGGGRHARGRKSSQENAVQGVGAGRGSRKDEALAMLGVHADADILSDIYQVSNSSSCMGKFAVPSLLWQRF
jgi:hypothetical protein